MGKQKKQGVFFKAEPELYTRFQSALETDSKLHNFESLSVAAAIRQFMRDYCERVESTASSAAGRHAAKVLSKGKRAA